MCWSASCVLCQIVKSATTCCILWLSFILAVLVFHCSVDLINVSGTSFCLPDLHVLPFACLLDLFIGMGLLSGFDPHLPHILRCTRVYTITSLTCPRSASVVSVGFLSLLSCYSACTSVVTVSLHVFHTIAEVDSGRNNHSRIIQSRLPCC